MAARKNMMMMCMCDGMLIHSGSFVHVRRSSSN